MTVRKMNTSDLFDFLRLVKKIGIKDDLKGVVSKFTANKEATQAEIGVDVAFAIMEIFSDNKAEEEIYNFLSKPFQCAPEDVKNNDLTDTIQKITEIADVEMWKSFFKKATQ